MSGPVPGTAVEDGSSSTVDALANASDADPGAALQVVGLPGQLPAGVIFDLATQTFSLDSSDAAYQRLAAGETALVTVAYGVSDGFETTPASVSWTVAGTNDAPVVSGPVAGGAVKGGAASTLLALANASDADTTSFPLA